jgi:hypothetical protein
MKKLFAKIGLMIMMSLMMTMTVQATVSQKPLAEGQTINQAKNETLTVNDVFPEPGDKKTNQYENAARALPNIEGGTDQAFAIIINTILEWAMFLTLIALVVAGIFFLIALGDDDEIKKAKDIFQNLLIGLAIMSAAYGFVTGISQFNFFD